MLNRLEVDLPIVRMGTQQSRMGMGKLTSKGSKGSLVDVASFDFRREEMTAAAEFRRDYFQSRFSTAQKCILIFTHLSFQVTIFLQRREWRLSAKSRKTRQLLGWQRRESRQSLTLSQISNLAVTIAKCVLPVQIFCVLN